MFHRVFENIDQGDLLIFQKTKNDFQNHKIFGKCQFSLAMPILVVLLVEAVGEWCDDASETTFIPIFQLPTDVERFGISDEFVNRVIQFFVQISENGNSKLEMISPMRECKGLPLVALYSIDTGNER